MARPKSTDKRNAIMDAAVRVIVKQGLSAPTATIAKEAGISNGSLFTYFATKDDLFNHLYLEIKAEIAAASLHEFPTEAALRQQVLHVWTASMEWGASNTDKRRALALLKVSDQITPKTQAAGFKLMAGFESLIEQMRIGGSLRNAPKGFIPAVLNALAETTMDFMVKDPAHARKHCTVGFETFWRAVS